MKISSSFYFTTKMETNPLDGFLCFVSKNKRWVGIFRNRNHCLADSLSRSCYLGIVDYFVVSSYFGGINFVNSGN